MAGMGVEGGKTRVGHEKDSGLYPSANPAPITLFKSAGQSSNTQPARPCLRHLWQTHRKALPGTIFRTNV